MLFTHILACNCCWCQVSYVMLCVLIIYRFCIDFMEKFCRVRYVCTPVFVCFSSQSRVNCSCRFLSVNLCSYSFLLHVCSVHRSFRCWVASPIFVTCYTILTTNLMQFCLMLECHRCKLTRLSVAFLSVVMGLLTWGLMDIGNSVLNWSYNLLICY